MRLRNQEKPGVTGSRCLTNGGRTMPEEGWAREGLDIDDSSFRRPRRFAIDEDSNRILLPPGRTNLIRIGIFIELLLFQQLGDAMGDATNGFLLTSGTESLHQNRNRNFRRLLLEILEEHACRRQILKQMLQSSEKSGRMKRFTLLEEHRFAGFVRWKLTAPDQRR